MLYTRLGQRDGQRVRCAEEDVERAVEEAIVRIERLLHGARAEAWRGSVAIRLGGALGHRQIES